MGPPAGGACREDAVPTNVHAVSSADIKYAIEGGKVFCVAMLELKDGKIVRQTAVQVWDE